MGQKVGEWTIEGELGRGSTGIVHKAAHGSLPGDFALKAINPKLTQAPEAAERFMQEAQAASSIDHPNVVHMQAPLVEAGTLYLPMEYLRGQPLRALMQVRKEPWPIDTALEIMRQAALGLGHVHPAGVVHGDISPNTLFVTEDGAVKVMGFNLGLGNPTRMAPEVLEGKQATGKSDLYSLGALMFELLSGQEPKDTFELSHHRDDVPEWLEKLVAALLQPNPNARPGGGRALAKLIEERVGAPAGPMPTVQNHAPPQPAVAAPRDPKSNLKRKLAAAGLLALVGAGFMLYQETLKSEPALVEPTVMSQASVQTLTTKCQTGTLAACIKLSRAYAEGHLGLKQDGQKATDLIYPACRAGQQKACDALTRLCDDLDISYSCSKRQ